MSQNANKIPNINMIFMINKSMGKRKYEEKLGIIPLRTSMAENPNLSSSYFLLSASRFHCNTALSLSLGWVCACWSEGERGRKWREREGNGERRDRLAGAGEAEREIGRKERGRVIIFFPWCKHATMSCYIDQNKAYNYCLLFLYIYPFLLRNLVKLNEIFNF